MKIWRVIAYTYDNSKGELCKFEYLLKSDYINNAIEIVSHDIFINFHDNISIFDFEVTKLSEENLRKNMDNLNLDSIKEPILLSRKDYIITLD